MKLKRQQRGFGLLELTLALAISVGLTGVVFYYLKQNQESFVVQAAIADLHQNFRAALDLLTRDIQAAGAGLPQFLGPIAGLDGGSSGGNQLPDEILILYGDPSFPSLTVTNGPIANRTTPIQVANPATGPPPVFTNGDNYVLYAVSQPNTAATADNAEFDVFTLSAQTPIAGGTQLTASASSAVNPPPWPNLAFPSAAALRVARLDQWVRYRVANNELQRSINGGAWVAVARNISDLQFQYWIEHVDTNTTPATVTTNLVDQVNTTLTNNRALIRAIMVTLTATTQMTRVADNQGQRSISQTIEVTPRNLVLPGFVINR
jgi:type II secretory pathway pseudopilin PulG